MRHRLFTILSAVSLLLWLITAAVIVRSFFACDMVERFEYGPTNGTAFHRSRIRVVCGYGLLEAMQLHELQNVSGPDKLAQFHASWEGPPEWTFNRFPADWPSTEDHYWHGFGFTVERNISSASWSAPLTRAVTFPLWLPLALFTIIPAICTAGWRKRHHRLKNSLCGQCGYDLRATSGRCPECGAAPVGAAR